MKKTAMGQPQLPASGVPTAFDTLSADWSTSSELWEFVDFSQVYCYLRGSKSLNIPEEFRSIIPKRLG